MNGVPFPIGPCVMTLVAVAALSDLRFRRIPNWLVAMALVIALPVQCALFGVTTGTLAWLGGCVTGGLVFLPAYLLRALGAGDVKLMAAVGSFCGALGAFEIAVAAGVIGGVFALVMMARHRRLKDGLTNTMSMLTEMAVLPNSAPRREPPASMSSVGTLPYGVAIALGATCVLFASV